MELSPAHERFILHWGEMGTRWGINRTVAQIHALLYTSEKPLPAEEIMQTLGVARSNVSTSLRELIGWGLISVVHERGDRRDHYTTHDDVWEMFRVILAERKKREIDPTIAVLRECDEQFDRRRPGDRFVAERIGALTKFFETSEAWYNQISQLSSSRLEKFLKLGVKLGVGWGGGRG